MYALQDKMTYPGAGNDSRILNSIEHRSIVIPTPEGQLFGLHRQLSDSPMALIYFGGNAEDVSGMLQLSQRLNVGQFYGLNYRGYGSGEYQSEGAPSETLLRKDAERFIQHLVELEGIELSNIIVMGRSLGCAVAIHATEFIENKYSNNSPKGLILVTPFSSVVDVAKGHFPWMPVQWLIKNPWRNEQQVQQLTAPAFFILAGEDRIVPAKFGEKLYQFYAGPKTKQRFESHGHNNVHFDDGFFQAINQFIQSL